MLDPNRTTVPIREISNRISLVFMLTLAAALLLLGRAETVFFDRARQVVTDLAAPLLEMASRPVTAARHLIERTGEYAYIFDENERLRAENARLLAWKEAALKLESKLARYEALLNIQLDPDIKYVGGRVISDNGGPFVDTVIVNAGRADGVASGDAVVDTDGLLGRVVSTGEKASRVLLLSDLNSRMPVSVEPAHYKAILAGDNTEWPRLEYLGVETSISPGDRVVTSGDGGLIPPGLPVGVVIKTDDGAYRVETFADRDRLDFVRVLKYVFPKEVNRQDPPSVLTGPPAQPAPPPPQVVLPGPAHSRAAIASPTRPATSGATAATSTAPTAAEATPPKPKKNPVSSSVTVRSEPSAPTSGGRVTMQPIPDSVQTPEALPETSDTTRGASDTPGEE